MRSMEESVHNEFKYAYMLYLLSVPAVSFKEWEAGIVGGFWALSISNFLLNLDVLCSSISRQFVHILQGG